MKEFIGQELLAHLYSGGNQVRKKNQTRDVILILHVSFITDDCPRTPHKLE